MRAYLIRWLTPGAYLLVDLLLIAARSAPGMTWLTVSHFPRCIFSKIAHRYFNSRAYIGTFMVSSDSFIIWNLLMDVF